MEKKEINPSEDNVETEAPAEANDTAAEVSESAPEPVREAAPETAAEPEPASQEPLAESAPEPTPEAEVEPVPEEPSVPEPEAAPEVAPEPAPEEPVAESAPEPTPEAPVEPAPEEVAPAPEAAPEAAAEPELGAEAPVVESAPEPTPELPGKRSRSRRHLPRHERRQRTSKAHAKKPAKRGARTPIVRLPKPESERGSRQERRGVVVSAAMDKTVVVKVDTLKAHRKYGKVVRRSKKLHAHDEANSAKIGDVVRIVETRPLSATKCWRVVEIVEVAK